jgi:hypothetical protein
MRAALNCESGLESLWDAQKVLDTSVGCISIASHRPPTMVIRPRLFKSQSRETTPAMSRAFARSLCVTTGVHERPERTMVERSMQNTLLDAATVLSDAELLTTLKRLAANERQATAQLVAHLAEMDARRLYLGEGCSSLFTYCTQLLRLSEHAAYGRIEAARAARKFPAILEALASGALHLTAVSLIAPHLTPENVRGVIAAATHKTKRDVEELVAALRPQPPIAASVRRRPQATGGASEQRAAAIHADLLVSNREAAAPRAADAVPAASDVAGVHGPVHLAPRASRRDPTTATRHNPPVGIMSRAQRVRGGKVVGATRRGSDSRGGADLWGSLSTDHGGFPRRVDSLGELTGARSRPRR